MYDLGMDTSYASKLTALRTNLKKQGLGGFIVPRADRFQGENPAACDERLEWLTGFSGSAGTAIILLHKAVVLTDGRYTIQVKQQVDATLFETADSTKVKIGTWLSENIQEDIVIGYDPWLHTPRQISTLQEGLKNTAIRLKPVSENPVDAVWQDRPGAPVGRVEIFPQEYAGHSHIEKRERIAEAVQKAGAQATLIGLPDSICWLLNVRGSDVNYSPLVLSYALVHATEERIDWFVDPAKLTPEVQTHLGNSVQISDFADLEKTLEKLKLESVLLDFDRAPVAFKMKLEENGITVIDGKDPCVDPKSIKTKAEQDAIASAHKRDALAMVRFLRWLDLDAPGGLDELGVVAKLEECRAASPLYRGPSFSTIAGFGANGAIIHYRASPETNLPLVAPGLLLLDSGGQYPDGTTDITRTIAIGAPSMDMKVNNTLVLKGHIALARAHFPGGTTGAQIDALARQALWNAGLDYAHGTGHGVGCFLQVHEEAASISPRGKDALKAGMLISNEPGYYAEGEYGIRIESLVLVEEQGDGMLGFKTVTLVPIDKNLIVVEMLTDEERGWLNIYHEHVFIILSPHLTGEEAAWLRDKTSAI